jgi:hypothetical protein
MKKANKKTGLPFQHAANTFSRDLVFADHQNFKGDVISSFRAMAIDQNSPDRISGVTVVRQDKETSAIMSFPENGKLHIF